MKPEAITEVMVREGLRQNLMRIAGYDKEGSPVVILVSGNWEVRLQSKPSIAFSVLVVPCFPQLWGWRCRGALFFNSQRALFVPILYDAAPQPDKHDLDEYIRTIAYCMEQIKASMGPGVHQMTVIFDMDGWTFKRHGGGFAMKCVSHLIGIVQKHYPTYVGYNLSSEMH